MEFLKETYDFNDEIIRETYNGTPTVKNIDLFGQHVDMNDTNYYTNGYGNENLIKETPNYDKYDINENVNDAWGGDFGFEIEINTNTYTSNSHNLNTKKSTSRKLYNEEYNINRNNDYENINETFNVMTAFDNVSIVDLVLFEKVNNESFKNMANQHGVAIRNNDIVLMKS